MLVKTIKTLPIFILAFFISICSCVSHKAVHYKYHKYFPHHYNNYWDYPHPYGNHWNDNKHFSR